MSLRERKKDKTRVQLLESALVLIGKHGFAETTIDQIAAAVDVSPRTFLRYFPTKEDVIVSWVEDGMAIFLSCLEKRPTDEPPQRALLACAREMLAAHQARADFYLIIERTIASSPALHARKLEMSSVLADKVTTVLGQRARPSPKIDMMNELYPALVFAIMRVVIRMWVQGAGKRQLVEIFDEATALVPFEGVMTAGIATPRQ